MKHNGRGALSSAVWIVLAAGFPGAMTAWAEHFKPLSPNHTAYGVSQLNYGNIPQVSIVENSSAVKFMNPNHVTQAVAALIYSSSRGPQGAGRPTEVFLGCKVRVITPHGSTDISDVELIAAGVPQGRPLYSEHIWAPLEKVSLSEDEGDGKNDKSDKSEAKKRRIADGLGGNAESVAFERQLRLAHPGLFSLPSNSVVPGQQERAARCVCAELAALHLSADTFSDFKIRCP